MHREVHNILASCVLKLINYPYNGIALKCWEPHMQMSMCADLINVWCAIESKMAEDKYFSTSTLCIVLQEAPLIYQDNTCYNCIVTVAM